MMGDQVKLCSDCRFRRHLRDEGDWSPCGQVWNVPLAEARRQCAGNLWEPAISKASPSLDGGQG
jgi:hypothetical protein